MLDVRGNASPKCILTDVPAILVAGDVHGEVHQLRDILSRGAVEGSPVVLLGDIVSRGPDSIGCMHEVCLAVEEGRAVLIPGNHDQRAYLLAIASSCFGADARWSDSEALGPLVEEFRSSAASARVFTRFASLLHVSPLWRRSGASWFCHAALPAAARLRSPPTLRDVQRGAEPDLDTVLWGEHAGEPGSVISYAWADAIPSNEAVFIGHQPHSVHSPTRRYGTGGGSVVCMDTGAGGLYGKPWGSMSWLRLSRSDLDCPAASPAILALPVVSAAVPIVHPPKS